ncbi:MAG: AAA family ATPase, partial [Alloalcanivorax venustensis]
MQALDKALAQVGSVLLGKPEQLKLALACMLAGGHLLIEDLPGMGKTTLAHALARVFRLDYRRVQFTSDMLPADILGVSVFDPESQQFSLREGPVFCQLLLADEINRATPKTQGALLEAMEERQVTLDGVSRPLPSPFFVVATQNPVTQAGTFVLPESQLDRFLMRISLGYPAPDVELSLLAGGDLREAVRELKPIIEPSGLVKLVAHVSKVRATRDLLDYVQRLLEATRADDRLVTGLSPRAGLGL